MKNLISPTPRGWGHARYYIAAALADRYPWIRAVAGASRYDFWYVSRADEDVRGFSSSADGRARSAWSRTAVGHREIRTPLGRREVYVWEHIAPRYGEAARMTLVETIAIPAWAKGDATWLARVVDAVARAIDAGALRPIEDADFTAQLRPNETRSEHHRPPEWPFGGAPLSLDAVLAT